MKAEWVKIPLGKLCKVQSGSSNTQDAVPNGQYMFFDRSKKPKRSSQYLFDCEALIIAGEGAEFRPKKFNGKFDLHQRAYAIHGFGDQLLGDYLFYYLEYVHEYFQKVAVGATVKSLRQRHFDDLPVIVPPIEEQRKIVKVLDEAFAAIATATANTERNLANARELEGAVVSEALRKLPAGTKSSALSTFCEVGRVITYGVIKLGDHVVDGVPCLRTSNVRWLEFELDGMKFIKPELSQEYKRTILKGGEVLVNVRGTLGGIAVASDEMAGWNVSREVAVVPSSSEQIDPHFLAFWIGSEESQKWLTGVLKGAAYTGINISDLRNLNVPILPMPLQLAMVSRISNALGEARALSRNYEAKIERLYAVKQSLLHRVFTGELAVVAPHATNDNWKTSAFTAQVIAFAYRRHLALGTEATFGRVKAQKALHLCESVGRVDLGRTPIKDAAGPNDFQHMLAAEDWAKANEFFEFVVRPSGNGYSFRKLPRYDAMVIEGAAALKPVQDHLERAIGLIAPMNSEEAELLATVHAAWNNLILDGVEPTEDAIIREARENWHTSKLKFSDGKFREAIATIRAKGIVPDGSAKRVGGQEALAF